MATTERPCIFKNAGVICNTFTSSKASREYSKNVDCSKCGWNPKVAEERRNRIRGCSDKLKEG